MMLVRFRTCLLLLIVSSAIADDGMRLRQSSSLPPLPQPISNNAVAAVSTTDNEYLVSFSGLAAGRTHADAVDVTWVYDGNAGTWSKAQPVPGGVGRLASVAAAAGDRAYVFGGYSVAEDGTEVSTTWVHAFDPGSGEFEALTPMPVAVDDAVAVTYQDRFIYLISGWHDLGNVNLVQRYDTQADSWVQATPTPGAGVFGHAGGIVDNNIVYCDGVAIQANADRRRDFVAYDGCYLGIIDADDTRRIDWRVLPAHPGAPRYRMAASGMPESGSILFVGGSENPYNYNGIGYDGEASEPVGTVLLFDIASTSWTQYPLPAAATMDHRALVRFGSALVTVGGMGEEQRVLNEVYSYTP